jgi:hypothetical protein
MYSGVAFTQKIEKHWDPKYYDANQNTYTAMVVNDTTRGFFYGQAVNPSVSASYNPQLFGTYQFTKPGSRIEAIRHIIRPSVSFSYIPVLKGMATSMYKKVQSDTLGTMKEYSIFEGNIYQTPTLSSKAGSVAFSLVNILEAKVFAKDDTTGKAKKIKLIDNFSLNTSYNIFADTITKKWAPLSMNFRTTLFQNLNLAASGNFSFYGLDSKGQEINKSYYSQTKKPLRMTNLTASLDFDLGQLIKGKGKKKSPDQVQQSNNPYDDSNKEKLLNPVSSVENTSLPLDKYGYVRFDVPWTLRMAYSFYLTKTLSKSIISQTLSLSGDLSLTKKTKITYTTGYDVSRKEITMTSIGIMRDLHCWDMSINWIPTGYMKSWNFTIKVKASVLADLKYDRRKDFRDQY